LAHIQGNLSGGSLSLVNLVNGCLHLGDFRGYLLIHTEMDITMIITITIMTMTTTTTTIMMTTIITITIKVITIVNIYSTKWQYLLYLASMMNGLL